METKDDASGTAPPAPPRASVLFRATAHDLRGIVSVMQGALGELELASEGAGGGAPFVAMLRRSATTLSTIAERMSFMGEVEGNAYAAVPVAGDLGALTEKAVAAAQALTERSKVKATLLPLPKSVVRLTVDERAFLPVARDLIIGSVRRARAAVTVRVEEGAAGALPSLVIEDDGPPPRVETMAATPAYLIPLTLATAAGLAVRLVDRAELGSAGLLIVITSAAKSR